LHYGGLPDVLSYLAADLSALKLVQQLSDISVGRKTLLHFRAALSVLMYRGMEIAPRAFYNKPPLDSSCS
jgi:hypothetical protein